MTDTSSITSSSPNQNTETIDEQLTQQLMLSEQEQLIQVDTHNVVLGSVGKVTAHQGAGVLHRAFSAFLFDNLGRVLIAKRSASKPLWPLFWSDSCSSHQWFPDETAVHSAYRRIPFELGVTLSESANLQAIFAYEYHATYSPSWSENEINSIIIGRYDGACAPNAREVAEYVWLEPEQVSELLNTKPEQCAPWFKIAWDGLLERGSCLPPL